MTLKIIIFLLFAVQANNYIGMDKKSFFKKSKKCFLFDVIDNFVKKSLRWFLKTLMQLKTLKTEIGLIGFKNKLIIFYFKMKMIGINDVLTWPKPSAKHRYVLLNLIITGYFSWNFVLDFIKFNNENYQ